MGLDGRLKFWDGSHLPSITGEECSETWRMGKLGNVQRLTLDFNNCRNLADLSSAARVLKEAKAVTEMKLIFSCCVSIVDFSWLLAIADMKDLVSLHIDLSGCQNLRDVQAIAQALQKTPGLRKLHLNFAACIGLSDVDGIRCIAQAMGVMTSLESCVVSLKGCERLPAQLQKTWPEGFFSETKYARDEFLKAVTAQLQKTFLDSFFSDTKYARDEFVQAVKSL